MRANRTHSNIVAIMLTVLVGTAFVLAGCGNPFQIGLGDDVDLNTPDVSINTGQLYLSGTEVFTGTFTDDFAVAAVDLSFNNGSTFLSATLNQSNRTWSISVNTAAYPDGENYVQVRVTDTAGKQITKQALFYIDNHNPLIVVTTPINVTTAEALDSPPPLPTPPDTNTGYTTIEFTGVYNGNVQIKGEAGDQFGIESVEYQILDASDSVITDWTSSGVDGTNSWSFSINTNDITAGAATIQVAVRATDRAGNVSAGMMHTDAVVANNGGDAISVEALVSVVNGTLTSPVITPDLITRITNTTIDLNVDQSADDPTFTISNPDETSPIGDNVLSSAPRFTGTVEDDYEGVDESTIQILVNRTSGTGTLPGWVGNWTDVTGTTGGGLLVRWSADVSGLLDGDYQFQVRASDNAGAQGTSNAVAFRVDTGAPAVVVSTPAQGSYHNSAFTISGTATDGQGISYVNVSVDDGVSWIPTVVTPAGGNDYDWTVDIDPDAEGMSDGTTTIKIEANDGISTSNFNLQVNIDLFAPTATFLTPVDGTTVNETVVVQGTASDDNVVSLVEISIDGAAFTSLPGLYTWNRSIDTTGYSDGPLTVDIRVTDIAGNTYTTSGYNLVVDQSQDLPTVTFVSPTAGQHVAGTLNVSGTASDDDGVVVVRMQLDLNDDGDYDDEVNLNGDGDTDDPYEHEYEVYDLTGTTLWSTTLNSGGELYGADGGTGTVTIMVWAEDDHVTGTQQERTVQFDAGAPVVSVTSPSQGSYQNDTFNIAGTATDANGVTSVNVSVDGGSNWTPATVLVDVHPVYDWDLDIDPAAIPDGPLTIMIQASDGSSTSDTNLQVVIDKEDPTASFISPAESSSVNGEVIIRGVSSDNSQVSLVELRIGPPTESFFTLTDQYYNWDYTIDSFSYANATYATETPPGSSVWELSVTARVTDIAGNQYETSGYTFLIDNDLDKPTATFVSPSAGQHIGGPVIVTGTAFDDDAVEAVYMRLDLNGDGDYDDAFDLNGDGDDVFPLVPDDLFEQEGTWVEISGTTLWSQELNNAGELYEVEGGHDGTVTIQVQVEDIYNTMGNTVELTVVFDDTIPRVENLSHSSSDYVREEFTLTADVTDDDAVDSVWISYNGGTDYTQLLNHNDLTRVQTYIDAAAISWDAINSDWDLHVAIDTLSTLPGLSGPIDSDILYLRIRVTDFAGYQSLFYINLNVDNEYPTGGWDTGSAPPDQIAGNPALVQGTAEDDGAVSGFGAAHVFFTNPDNNWVINPLTGVETNTLGTAMLDDSSTGTVVAVPMPYPTNLDDIIKIDDLDEFGDDNPAETGDDDGFNEEITLSLGVYTWAAEFNSTVLDDGDVDIHYVIFDASGNGTYYFDDTGFVMNEPPQIDTLTVGTNLDFSASGVDLGTAEEFEYGLPFEARELLYVNIDASDPLTGVAVPTYQVFTRYAETWNSAPLAANTEINGVTGPPVTNSPNPDYDGGETIDLTDFDEGDTIEFYALVTDTDGITAIEYFSVVIDNDDDEAAPTFSIDPITNSSVVDGHVEADDEARDFTGSYDPASYVTQNDTTADVSGTINITGTVNDDQRIDEIWLQIDAYDGLGGTAYGTSFLLASWNAAAQQLEYNEALPVFAATGGVDVLDSTFIPGAMIGHTADFTFEWNSAELEFVTAESVTISLDVVDRGGNAVAPTTVDVDVVPYVTGIDRSDGITQTRTRWGKYTLADGDTDVLISGYNLDPSAVAFYNTAGTNSTTLSVNSVAADYTSVSIDISAANHSGWLWIENDEDGAGGVDPVVAINNFNDNTLTQNMQDDGSGIPGTLWNDDLYVQLWDVDNDFQGSTDAQHPSMAVNSSGTQYAAWSYYNDSERRYGTDTQVRTTYGGSSYDPTEWNDIAFSHTYDDYFIVNLWNQNVMGTYQSLRLHAFEDATMSDDTDVIVIDALDDQLYQYRNPRIAVKDGGADETIIYVAYYDSDAGTTALKFASFLYDRGGDNLTAYLGGTNVIVDNSADVGLWCDIAIDGDGIPFIVYYDTTNSRLMVARADDDTTDGTVTWDTAQVDSGNSYFGEYVSAAVDYNGTPADSSDDTIYVSTYRNASGDLEFYSAPHVTTGTDFTFSRTTVDEEGAVGAWSEITEYGGEPFIAYINTSGVGTPLGLKYAYYDGVNWEYGTVPVAVTVQSVRTGIAPNPQGIDVLGPGADYTVTVSYGSGSYYFARLRPEEP